LDDIMHLFAASRQIPELVLNSADRSVNYPISRAISCGEDHEADEPCVADRTGTTITMRKCHYETLGVDKDASLEEIKSAFRKLSMETHPDVAGRGGNAERFKEISHAASVLTSLPKRQAYDRQLEQFGGSFRRYAGFEGPATRKQPRPPPGSVVAALSRPRNFLFGQMALFATLSLAHYAMGTDERVKKPLDQDLVQAWKNPDTGLYETPAPWDPTYRRLQPKLQYVPRHQVRTRVL
jgi:molecular chaperone DnaJ